MSFVCAADCPTLRFFFNIGVQVNFLGHPDGFILIPGGLISFCFVDTANYTNNIEPV